MGNIILKANNLERVFSGKITTRAIDNVSFEIEKGEFFAIVGKSGSGKSTLLRMLGLLDDPTNGTFIIDKTDVLKLTDNEKTGYRLQNLGYIFQEYALFPELTALENVCLPLMAKHKTLDKSLKDKAKEILKKVDLEDRINFLPNQLSGGQQQRVAIARSLVNDPKILFADEPCANLDSKSSKMIMDLLLDLNRQLDLTIVMVSHEPDDEKLVHRVMTLSDGKIEKIKKVNNKK